MADEAPPEPDDHAMPATLEETMTAAGIVRSEELVLALAQHLGVKMEDLRANKEDDTQCVLVWLRHASPHWRIEEITKKRRARYTRAKIVPTLFQNHRRVVWPHPLTCPPWWTGLLLLAGLVLLAWLHPSPPALEHALLIPQLIVAVLFASWRRPSRKESRTHRQAHRQMLSEPLLVPRRRAIAKTLPPPQTSAGAKEESGNAVRSLLSVFGYSLIENYAAHDCFWYGHFALTGMRINVAKEVASTRARYSLGKSDAVDREEVVAAVVLHSPNCLPLANTTAVVVHGPNCLPLAKTSTKCPISY